MYTYIDLYIYIYIYIYVAVSAISVYAAFALNTRAPGTLYSEPCSILDCMY
jgi:hypothetical protein